MKSREKKKDVRQKESEALRQELEEARRRLFDLRTQAVTEKLENPMQMRRTRRQIAMLHTILRERELAARNQAAANQ